MSVATPRWQRTLTLRAWIERPRQSFIRILSPAKEAGIGSLRIGSEIVELPAEGRAHDQNPAFHDAAARTASLEKSDHAAAPD